jgi:predicted TIM-barrel fold metal-dependent hydrolase
MYGVEHNKRVLRTFPGVFSGIGEFSIHKEFVSSKVAGDTASLTDPALDRILAFAGEAGLVVIFHNDIDMPFARPDTEPIYLAQMKSLLRRHPDATIIWAHIGLGRVVFPVQSSASATAAERVPGQMGRIVRAILDDPTLAHVNFDLSWDELAKYIVGTPETIRNSAEIVNAYPDRFLFGTDEVAPASQEATRVHERYARFALTPATRAMVLKGNYERIFNEARRNVRAWEKENLE